MPKIILEGMQILNHKAINLTLQISLMSFQAPQKYWKPTKT